MNHRKFFKSAAAALSICLLAGSLVGCGDKQTAENPKDSGKEEVVTLKWVLIGGGMPDNYDKWKEKVDDYLEEKIGVHLEVDCISWGDWGTKRSTMVNTGSDYDIMFTDISSYKSDLQIGAFLDLTDMLETSAPELKSFIPESLWDAVKEDGKIYAVPTYKDSSATWYHVWDKALGEELNINYGELKELNQITAAFEKINKEKGILPMELTKYSGTPFINIAYDTLGLGIPLVGINYDDPSLKVVSVLEQDDILEQYKIYHEWYTKGFINKDAATATEAASVAPYGMAQGWEGAAAAWGAQRGCEVQVVQYGKTRMSRDTVQGSMNGISASSKHPEKALQLLQLANTDTTFRDMLGYGLEGENFTYSEDKKQVHVNNDKPWPVASYAQASFFTLTPKDDGGSNWDEVKALNEAAVVSPAIGISIDTTEFQDELSNCNEVWAKYAPELNTGTVNPEELIPQMMKEFRDAGFDHIQECVQKQVDALK